MTEEEALVLTRYVKACCPQQAMDKYTPDAWFDLLADLDFGDCQEAVKAVAKRQPFVAPAEIRAEVRKIREDRLARTPLPAPPADATETGRYQEIIRANVERIADGKQLRNAIGGGAPLPGDPPAEWQQAREAMAGPAPVKPDPREVAAEQVREAAEQRARREAGERAS